MIFFVKAGVVIELIAFCKCASYRIKRFFFLIHSFKMKRLNDCAVQVTEVSLFAQVAAQDYGEVKTKAVQFLRSFTYHTTPF